MTALRDWSKPGRRAELLAAAWQAGETNIAALAEAARISRPTVYADLRSRGIEPDHRPKEHTTMTSTPVVIDGVTGESLEDLRILVDEFVRTHPGDKAAADRYIKDIQPIFFAVYRYTQLRKVLTGAEQARRDRDRALHLVETRWEALNTAANWLAAHHAYTVAVDEARTAIDTWAKASGRAREATWFTDGEAEVYEQRILPAGYPPVAPIETTGEDEARRLHEKLDAAHARRKTLAAETLACARPAAS